MSITEVRTRFHALIDEVENPSLLQRFFEVMQTSAKSSDTGLWNTLSESDQQEVLAAYEESNDEKNLISHKAVIGKHKKWLKK
jgi:hypothetical protein